MESGVVAFYFCDYESRESNAEGPGRNPGSGGLLRRRERERIRQRRKLAGTSQIDEPRNSTERTVSDRCGADPGLEGGKGSRRVTFNRPLLADMEARAS